MMKLINELYNYRELLKTNVKKEIRGKYKGSFLGVLWSFINPLLMVFVYAIVFQFLMPQEVENFLVYLVIGVIPWNLFAMAMGQGMGCIRANAGIVKKVYFPREILPISVALSTLINFFISCAIILIFCLFGVGISWHIIIVPIIAMFQFFITLGLILSFSAINVYVKDTEHIVMFFINMLFYATPIVYPITQIPAQYIWVLNLNPFKHIIFAYRDLFMYHQLPTLNSFLAMIFSSIVVMFIGLLIFRKLERGFAEEI